MKNQKNQSIGVAVSGTYQRFVWNYRWDIVVKLIKIYLIWFQYFFRYLEKSYAAFMMGTELDELGEFDAEFIDNISKFVNIEYTSIKYAQFK